MAGVNAAGTYRLEDPNLVLDTGGTPIDLKIAATSMGLTPTNNYVDHPRTGAGSPYQQLVDATWEMTLNYVSGFGTDGIQTLFASLAGTEVEWLLETEDGAVSATFPTFAFTADVPFLGIEDAEIGEFADGTITIPIKGQPVRAIA
jgi:hypothetical protein